MPKSNSNNHKKIPPVVARQEYFWIKTCLKLIPPWISPNAITIIRLIFIPFIVLFAAIGLYWSAVGLFLLASLLDTVDGALARCRHQITDWGLLLDPLADKLLIITVVLYLAIHYPFYPLLICLAFFDLAMIAIAASRLNQGQKRVKSSNFWGKTKMLLEVAGLTLALLWLKWPSGWLLYSSALVVSGALVFQIKSMASYF